MRSYRDHPHTTGANKANELYELTLCQAALDSLDSRDSLDSLHSSGHINVFLLFSLFLGARCAKLTFLRVFSWKLNLNKYLHDQIESSTLSSSASASSSTSSAHFVYSTSEFKRRRKLSKRMSMVRRTWSWRWCWCRCCAVPQAATTTIPTTTASCPSQSLRELDKLVKSSQVESSQLESLT